MTISWTIRTTSNRLSMPRSNVSGLYRECRQSSASVVGDCPLRRFGQIDVHPPAHPLLRVPRRESHITESRVNRLNSVGNRTKASVFSVLPRVAVHVRGSDVVDSLPPHADEARSIRSISAHLRREGMGPAFRISQDVWVSPSSAIPAGLEA